MGDTALAPTGGEAAAGWTQRGLATYYAAALAGRRTASGATYRPAELTAAHRSLPFGTRVRVTRVASDGTKGRSVIVRINDRGPYGRAIIDLSYAAARRLDMVASGVVRVELEALP